MTEMKENLHKLCDPIAEFYRLECDGLTRYLHKVLWDNGIGHKCYAGEVVHLPSKQTISLHYWIEVGDWCIDYRLDRWIKGIDCPTIWLPHMRSYGLSYTGIEVELEVLPQWLLDLMSEE